MVMSFSSCATRASSLMLQFSYMWKASILLKEYSLERWKSGREKEIRCWRRKHWPKKRKLKNGYVHIQYLYILYCNYAKSAAFINSGCNKNHEAYLMDSMCTNHHPQCDTIYPCESTFKDSLQMIHVHVVSVLKA